MNSPLTHPRRRGIALVVTLAALLLLSGIIVAFFSNAVINRRISTSNVGQLRAQTLALTAADLIVSDLQAEAFQGSEATLVNDFAVLKPLSAASMEIHQPQRITGWETLLKTSQSTPLWPANADYQNIPGPARALAASRTDAASANGRVVQSDRWTLPHLGTGAFPASLTPHWIPILRDGVAEKAADLPALSVLADDSPTNYKHAIGRFAYTIYDIGGLVDVNAAGFPSGSGTPSVTTLARKGNPLLADLSLLGFSHSGLQDLIAWRHTASSASQAAFTKSALETMPARGFLTPSVGDQMFVSRSELIAFWNKRLGLNREDLRHFTTFSREVNAPSWGPTFNAADFGGQNGTDFAYADNATIPVAKNRFFPSVRVTQPFTRADGSEAKIGEPLVATRFDLHRLSWITHSGLAPAGVSAAAIQAAFGLVRESDGSWTYNHGNATDILSLEEVAAQGREPDFFELLQAGILAGSTGLFSGDPTQPASETLGGELYRANNISWRTVLVRTDPDGKLVHSLPKYQIMQIGANLIDQYDTDSYPTELRLNNESFWGVENLPYINSLGQTCLRPPEGGNIAPNTYQAYVHQWLTAALWNPHQNATFPPAAGPDRIRLLVRRGEVYPWVRTLFGNPSNHSGPPYLQGRVFSNAQPGWIEVALADVPNRFAEPTGFPYDKTSVSSATGKIEQFGWRKVGIYLGWSFSPDNRRKVAACAALFDTNPTFPEPILNASGNPNGKPAQIHSVLPMNVELQYQDATGDWKTYQTLYSVNISRDAKSDPYMAPDDPAWLLTSGNWNGKGPFSVNSENWVLGFLDPRTPRLNMASRFEVTVGGRPELNLTHNFRDSRMDTSRPVGPHFPKNPTLNWDRWEEWVNNHSNLATSYYTDRDFVRRVGDAAGWAGADPQPDGNFRQRPLQLDRPFQSVGEIAFVLRDDPWKTLNFSDARSADAGLLDLFCLAGAASSTPLEPTPLLVAGSVNLNTARPEVLKSLLSGAGRNFSLSNPMQSDQTLTATAQLDTLAKAVTSSPPLQNLADLVKLQPTAATAASPGSKAEREAFVRALAGSSGTRTWNVLIDVIAQSGRFSTGATSENQFLVEGERRFWVHVAIDRFTGRVVDRQLELITE